MADAGKPLRALVAEEASLDRWFEVLPLYADVQLDLAGDVDALLELGVPDLRLATLPEEYERLMDEIDAEERFREASGRVAELGDELAAYGIRETLQHDDLHDGQVFVRDGRHLLMDWGDACISHPFFTLSVTLEGVLAWGLDDVEDSEDIGPFRDAYLKPFAERYDGDLVAAATDGDASRLGLPGRQRSRARRRQADAHPAADVPRRAAGPVSDQPGGRITPTVSRWKPVNTVAGLAAKRDSTTSESTDR